MRIEKLELKNFRSHAATSLALDRITFVLGANHTGKTSIAAALEYLLCGRCAFTDDAGRGADDLVRKGTDLCQVSASVVVGEDRLEMARTRAAGATMLDLHREKQSIGGKQAQEWLTKRLSPLPVLSAVLNSSRFLDMPPAQQKNLLATILADKGIAVPSELHWGDTPDTVSITELDTMHKRAYERRTEVNRKLMEFETLAEPESKETPTVDAIKSRLSEVRKERDGVLEQKTQRLSAHKNSGRRRTEIADEIARLDEAILPIAEEKRLKTVADAGTSDNASIVAARLRGQIELKNDQIGKIEKLGAIVSCPTCFQSIDKKGVQGVVKTLKDEAADLHKQLALAERGAREYDEAQKARKRISESIGAVGQKESLESELVILPDAEAPDVSDLQTRLVDLDARIAKGEGVLLDVNEQRRRIADYNEKSAQRDKLRGELKHLEAVLEFSGPDGARKQATGDKLVGFNTSLNAALEPFGYNALIFLDDFAMQVGGPGMPKALDIHLLSESERFRFSVAFQIALAQVTGIDLVIIDRADVLDRESRRQLTAMLMQSGIGQAVICSTTTDPLPSGAPDGVQFVQLVQEGGITRIAAVTGKEMVAA